MGLYLGNNFVKIGDKTSSFSIKLKSSVTPISTTWYNWKNGNYKFDISLANGSFGNTDNCFALTYGNGKFVAINYISNRYSNGQISSDGINWTSITVPIYLAYDITYGNDKFVAVGRYNRTMYQNGLIYSFDGENWTNCVNPNKYLNLSHVAFGNNMFIATCYSSSSNKYIYSYDGINWTQGEVPTNQDWKIIYGKDKFILLPYNTNIGYYSYDGINWKETDFLMSSPGWVDIIYGNDCYIAYNQSQNFVYSKDGITWEQKKIPNGYPSYSFTRGTYGNGIFMLPTDSPYIMYTSDFINWNLLSTDIAQDWYGIAYGDNKFVMIQNIKNQCISLTDNSKLAYTKEETPATESKVYNEPNVESNLVITSTNDSSITLSDKNVYIRNPDGDITN